MQNCSSVLSVGFGLKIEMMFMLLVLGATAPRERFFKSSSKKCKSSFRIIERCFGIFRIHSPFCLV